MSLPCGLTSREGQAQFCLPVAASAGLRTEQSKTAAKTATTRCAWQTAPAVRLLTTWPRTPANKNEANSGAITRAMLDRGARLSRRGWQ